MRDPWRTNYPERVPVTGRRSSLDNPPPSRWDQLWSVFHAALELPESDRPNFLRRSTEGDPSLLEDLERMLASHEQPDPLLETGGSFRSLLTDAVHQELKVGEKLGPYELISRLGEGGMGVVYRALQREPIERTVALKVIRFGMQSREVIARFELERQSLAKMSHPAIAKLYDARITDEGRPYFAMEEVSGAPLTEYADQHRLEVKSRIGLFITVCRGVEHAHQKGILHRDIKPTNILVARQDGKPRPKIIDFGIAKVTDQHQAEGALSTVLGRIIGTPDYMSPEQASDEHAVDTRSDVYALGVTLYELLVGELPFVFEDRSLAETHRILDRDEAPRASSRISSSPSSTIEARSTTRESLRKDLIGDLDRILTMCLAKDKEERYGSAAELAADLERFLDDQPVSAVAPSLRYRSMKFFRRNRGGALAGSAVLLALLVGLLTTLSMARIARKERQVAVVAQGQAETARDLAQSEAENARAVQEFLESMLTAADPSSDLGGGVAGRDVRVVDILDDAGLQLETSFSEQPEIRLSLLNTLSRTYRSLGLFSEAEEPTLEALSHSQNLHGASHPKTLNALFQLASLRNEEGRFEEAEELLRERLQHHSEIDGQTNNRADDRATEDRILAQSLLNDTLFNQGRIAEAVGTYREVLDESVDLLGSDHELSLKLMNDLAAVLNRSDRVDEAVALYQASAEKHAEVLGPRHPSTLLALGNLGAALIGQGNLEESEKVLSQAVSGYEEVLGPDNSGTLRTRNNLGALLFRREKWADAEAVFSAVLEGYTVHLDEEHPLVLVTRANIARVTAIQGRHVEAEGLYRELLAATQRSLPPNHPNVAVFSGGMGVCLFEMKRYSDAESHLLSSYQGHLQNLGPQHRRTQQGAKRLADLYNAWGRPQSATKYLEPAPQGESPPKN